MTLMSGWQGLRLGIVCAWRQGFVSMEMTLMRPPHLWKPVWCGPWVGASGIHGSCLATPESQLGPGSHLSHQAQLGLSAQPGSCDQCELLVNIDRGGGRELMWEDWAP